MIIDRIYSDGMVLQRDREVNICGMGVPGEVVRVEIDGLRAETVVAGDDSVQTESVPWKVVLPPHAAGGPYEMKVTGTCGGAASQRIIKDVLYGEVWFLNGQSNIEYALMDAKGGREELKTADYDEIRYYSVVKASYIDEAFLEAEASSKWNKCKAEIDGTANDFGDVSAIGYLAAVKLHKRLGVPVGLIDCYVGGCSVTCWIGMDRLKGLDEASVYLDTYFEAVNSKTPEQFQNEMDRFNAAVEAYEKTKAELIEADPDITPNEIAEKITFPWPPPMGEKSLFKPSGMYEAMARRVIPYTIRGIAFYQGEEDSPRFNRYKTLLKTMISQYREDWDDPELPVLIFQLPMFNEAGLEENYEWPNQRLVQASVADEDENCILIPLIDTGAYGEIHPWDKTTAADRFYRYAMREIYGAKDEAGYMTIKSIIKEDRCMLLEFDNTYGAIQLMENELTEAVSMGSQSLLNLISSTVYGFEVSTDGTNWSKAEAHIEAERIRLVAIDAEENYDFGSVTAVRYAFYSYGIVNIYNAKKQPLLPFVHRTS